jgi:hypothetical protein
MKISIKTLQGKQLPLEVEETLTVRTLLLQIQELKEKIQAEHGFEAGL